MKLGGLLSDGIRLGHRTGFDSGSTLDYVYRNEPRGFGRSAARIDRDYLDSIGWRGIRQRKLHLEELMCAPRMSGCGATGCRCRSWTSPPATAATCSRRLTASESSRTSILLRDYSDINVETGAR